MAFSDPRKDPFRLFYKQSEDLGHRAAPSHRVSSSVGCEKADKKSNLSLKNIKRKKNNTANWPREPGPFSLVVYGFREDGGKLNPALSGS